MHTDSIGHSPCVKWWNVMPSRSIMNHTPCNAGTDCSIHHFAFLTKRGSFRSVSKKRREWPEIRTIKAAANKRRKQKEHCLKTLQGWARCVISKVSVQRRMLNAKCRKWKGAISTQQNETNCQIFSRKNFHNPTFQRRPLTLQRSTLCCHALWNSLLDSRRFQGIQF